MNLGIEVVFELTSANLYSNYTQRYVTHGFSVEQYFKFANNNPNLTIFDGSHYTLKKKN